MRPCRRAVPVRMTIKWRFVLLFVAVLLVLKIHSRRGAAQPIRPAPETTEPDSTDADETVADETDADERADEGATLRALLAHGNELFAIGDEGIIRRSQDGGKHWTKETSHTDENLSAIA